MHGEAIVEAHHIQAQNSGRERRVTDFCSVRWRQAAVRTGGGSVSTALRTTLAAGSL